MEQFNRRDAIKTGVAGIAAALVAPTESWAQGVKTPLEQMLAGKALTDQYGKPLDPAILSKGPCLVVYGYGGCPMCQKITDTLAGVQEQLIKSKKPIPIVVISVQPKQDRTEMQDYMEKYYSKGLKQFANEQVGDATKAYDAGKSVAQSSRIFHIVCPPSEQAAEDLQATMGLPQNTKDAAQHSSFIVLFNDGQQHKFPDKTNPKAMNPGIRGLDTAATTPLARVNYGKEIAQKFIDAAVAIPAPQPLAPRK